MEEEGGQASGVSHTASREEGRQGGEVGPAAAAAPEAHPVEVEAEDEDFHSRATVRMTDPRMPSREEVLEPERTHLPFRNLCRHCLRGRGKEAPHAKQTSSSTVPETHMDFMFLGEEDDPGNTLTILVLKEKLTRMSLASVMPNKSTGQFLATRSLAFLKEIGCDLCDIILKSDQSRPCSRLSATSAG